MNTECLHARNEIATTSRSFSRCLSSWESRGFPNFLASFFLGCMEETECGSILSLMTSLICHRESSYLLYWFASLPYSTGYFLKWCYPRKRSQLSPMNPLFNPSQIQNKCDQYTQLWVNKVTQKLILTLFPRAVYMNIFIFIAKMWHIWHWTACSPDFVLQSIHHAWHLLFCNLWH